MTAISVMMDVSRSIAYHALDTTALNKMWAELTCYPEYTISGSPLASAYSACVDYSHACECTERIESRERKERDSVTRSALYKALKTAEETEEKSRIQALANIAIAIAFMQVACDAYIAGGSA